jgi:hypothetical protein
MNVPTKKAEELLSNWHHLIEGLNHNPDAFYKVLEDRIAARELPDVAIGRVTFPEKGLLSSHREYLRVTRGQLTFDICGAPFGKNAFFVSYWLGRLQNAGCLSIFLVALPGIGTLIESDLRPITYFEMDSAQMFQEVIHRIVVGHVSELIEAEGIEAIPEHELKPTMKQLSGL